jgi:arsenate reductase
MMLEPTRVLFVCTGNSARSQMAEALLNHAGDGQFAAFSAGTVAKGVKPYTIRVLAEVGIDWSGARSKSTDEFLGRPFDYVITVCDSARQTCPYFPGGTHKSHWDLPDPAEVEGTDAEKLDAFRTSRDAIELRVRELVREATESLPA